MTQWMTGFRDARGGVRGLAFAGLLLLIGVIQGCAQTEKDVALSPGVVALMQEFPAGSIDSVEEADEVRDAVAYENKVLDYRFGVDMDACTGKFLVNDCYDRVKLRLRRDRAALRPLSVEAERFKRSNKVRLRDEALVDAEQEERGKAAEREDSQRRFEEKQERYQDAQAADDASPPRMEEGAYTTGTPSRPKHPDTVLTPEERAKNMREYEEKQLESERKQENVRRKMAEREAKRAKRAADKGKEVTRRQKEAKD